MNSALVSHIRDIIQFRDSLILISHVESEQDIMKIWARWIITHRSMFPQKTICLPEDREYDSQLLVELIERGVATSHSIYLQDWLIEQSHVINRRFPWKVADAEFGGIHGDIPVQIVRTDTKVKLICDELETTIPIITYNKLKQSLRRNHLIMKHVEHNYIWFTCILYSLLDGKGLQWALPPMVMNILKMRLHCNTELFASPINNTLSRYYSLFPYDTVFGSCGNFFTAPDSDFSTGTFQVNPPFIDCLFTKTTERILRLLHTADEHNRELTFIYIMPQWEDFTTYNMVIESPYCIKQISLWPNTHFYYQHVTNTFVRARFGTSIIFLSTNINCCDCSLESDIVSAFSSFRKIY